MFGDRFFEAIADQNIRTEILKEVEAYLRPTLYSLEEGWFADYKRLRVVASKE